ncbi:hypothetical protein BD770DRAFT_413125 [Pilaira anomala]|nr:hypothetical protein BD770DRAFT_413125 [Pilaira anomala]
MDWERPTGQKKMKTQNSASSSKETSTTVTKMRGSYISKNEEPKVVNLINLMQEFEHYLKQGCTGMPINATNIGEQLTSCIVESYDNATSLFVYKTACCSRILNTCTTKQLKLFPDDKEKVNNLNESKMWKNIYEYPFNDIRVKSNINWKKYLTDEEIDEIENFKMKPLVELSPNVNEYIESLQKIY